MATSRIVKVRGGNYGASPTTINGVRGFTERVRYQFARGMSDGEIGPTSFTLVGMESDGNVIVDTYDSARLLLAASTGQLTFQTTVQGGTARKISYDNVTFTDAGPVTIQQEPGDGPTVAYQINWRGIFATADADIDDHVTIANDT